MIVFGPVPSRRLGHSLGINHVPAKNCTYSCIYCQVGRTTHLTIDRQEFYPVKKIVEDVERKIGECADAGNPIDYLTLVPDGEPTLDKNLGKILNQLRRLQIPLAVISNASLIDRPDVQEDLMAADWVSLKADAVDEDIWRKINRPHHRLDLAQILDGMLVFKEKFGGELVTETMLLGGVNDNEKALHPLCAFLKKLQPRKSYLSIPTRPPAEPTVRPPSPEVLLGFYKICSETTSFSDLLFEPETGEFVSTGSLAEDILGITAVHPLREAALRQMIAQAGGDWKVVENLLARGEVYTRDYRNERFYLRAIKRG